jgi:hypothetical protein
MWRSTMSAPLVTCMPCERPALIAMRVVARKDAELATGMRSGGGGGAADAVIAVPGFGGPSGSSVSRTSSSDFSKASLTWLLNHTVLASSAWKVPNR